MQRRTEMSAWVDQLKEAIPDYAKDARLNIDAVIKRSSLDANIAEGCALAAVFATGNTKLWTWIQASMEDQVEANAALDAAVTMAQNNTWYPYVEMSNDPQLEGLPANLRMNAIATSGGTSKDRFEAYSLAASIVGKCHFCVKSHYDTLHRHGWSIEQLRDVGRIAAVMTAVSRVMTG
jgi:lipoyl-dependent peroxiredoxin subunit D